MATFRKIWDILTTAEKRSAWILLCLMVVGMVLEMLGVSLVIPALALLTQGELAHHYPAFRPVIQSLGHPDQRSLVIDGMLLLVGVYLIKALFLAFLAWKQMQFAYGLQGQLSERLFAAYLRLPYAFHLQRNSAHLIRNAINEVNLFTSMGIIPGITLVAESLILFGLCSLLVFIQPVGTMIAVSILAVAAWGFNRFTRSRVAQWGKARQHHDGLCIQRLQEGLCGVKDVKLLGKESDFLEQFHHHNAQSIHAGQLQATLQRLPRLWLELLAISGLAILVISMLMRGGSIEGILPTLGLFAVATFRLMPSFNRVLGAVQSLRYGLPVIDLLHKEINLPHPEKVTVTSNATSPFSARLHLDRVSYTYPGGSKPALKDISLAIRCGESIGFIGTSGAGKSTLVDILLGLLGPDAGEVSVDGRDIRNNLRNWQDQIGYVPQAIFLTDDTLRRNVAFGMTNERIDDIAVQRAIRAAQLEDFVASLPDGLETIVGERGIRLSGGQRQRIGIARALYHDPAVLVLDEATSSLDAATEHQVMQSIRALQGSKTILIVAHRLSTVTHCDRVYRLEQGRVIESGASYHVLASKIIG